MHTFALNPKGDKDYLLGYRSYRGAGAGALVFRLKPGGACLTLFGKTYSSFAAVITYYFRNPEEALKRAKAAGKKPGYWYGGITLRSGKKGWAIYRGSKEVERYAVM